MNKKLADVCALQTFLKVTRPVSSYLIGYDLELDLEAVKSYNSS